MQPQQVKKLVVDHLLSQRRRCISSRDRHLGPYVGESAYRNDEGEASPVGCLIPRDAFTDEMNMHHWDNELVRGALVDAGVPIEDYNVFRFLMWAENLHDMIAPFAWQNLLRYI